MDESHRYRASAGVRAINELQPVLGLEFTATPQVERGTDSLPFRNVVYGYPLANAIRDGFVKEPAVATRENFDARNYGEEQLERLKLEDGIHIHESVKVELEVYARQTAQPRVKPFLLVVAQDVEHAKKLRALLESPDFFEGRYRGCVAEVHSKLRGDEGDENVERLLAVESPEEPTEVVVHVNMLKEGWDVTNLYTIVPLRAASSRTLVEQSIGRGLRLPYGTRTGVAAIDRLTIIAHDRFQEIIDLANEPGSIIRTGVVIGRDVPLAGRKEIRVPPEIERRILELPRPGEARDGPHFGTPAERAVAELALRRIQEYERLPRSAELASAETRAQLVRDVQEAWASPQGRLPGMPEVDVGRVVSSVVEIYGSLTIDIPRVVVVPKGVGSCGYDDFDLDASGVSLQPVPEDILIHHLQSQERERLATGTGVAPEQRLEDYLVRALIDFDDVNYDEQADLLYKLSGQLVARLGSYLSDETAVRNVLQYRQQRLAELIHSQMEEHRREGRRDYEARVTRGFTTLRAASFTVDADEEPRDFRAPVDEPHRIRGMAFAGFRKCLYGTQRFDTDTERRFAVLLEDDLEVLKWFKPSRGQLQIYGPSDQSYEPDFVIEAQGEKLLCETKRATEMGDPEVVAKADAATVWCEAASRHPSEHGAKPWRYLLIPHDEVEASRTLAGLGAAFEHRRRT